MIMYDKIVLLLDNKINVLKSMGNLSDDSMNQLKRLLKVKELMIDDNLFMKVSIETAYGILKDIGVSNENINRTYIELVRECKDNGRGKTYILLDSND